MDAKKEIRLVPDPPLYNYVDISVMDFPQGREGRERRRCKVTAEFAKSDVEQLQKRGLSFEEAVRYYEDWLYRVIRLHLACEWTCIGGWDEVVDIIKEKVKTYY